MNRILILLACLFLAGSPVWTAGALKVDTTNSEQKCKAPVRIILKTYNNPDRQKISAVKAAIKKLRPKRFGLRVPVYVVLWGIRGEKGVDKMTATKIANFSIQKMFPNPKLDKERRERVKRDIIGKTQRETITADLYLGSCAGFIFIAASSVNDFKNYLGKVALHEFNHIYQMPFLYNNPEGARAEVAWLDEGFAELWAMEQAVKFSWANKRYLKKQISGVKKKVRTRYPKGFNLKVYEKNAGDKLPIHSIEIGLVAADYLMNRYSRKRSNIKFIEALYKAINKHGWKSGFKRVTGKPVASFYKEFRKMILSPR